MNKCQREARKEFEEIIELLEQIGAPFKDSDGNYRPLIDIMKDWAKIWEEICNDQNPQRLL